MDEFEGVRGVASPARRALAAAGVLSVADLARFTEDEVLSWHGVGPRGVVALKELMAERRVSFRPVSPPTP